MPSPPQVDGEVVTGLISSGSRCPATPRCSIPRPTGSGRVPSRTASRSRSRTVGSSSRPPTNSRAGEVRALHYFDRDLVLFRTDDGRSRVDDAYCAAPRRPPGRRRQGRGRVPALPVPRLGVRRCIGPVHRDPLRQGERIPAKARVRPYPMIERGGAIWAWHHLTEGEPFYRTARRPRDGRRRVDEPPACVEFRISTSCQEMAENNHDFAHFQYVHGTESIPDGEEHIEGTYKRVKSPGLERETFGLGLGVVRVPACSRSSRRSRRSTTTTSTCAGSSPCP